MRLVIGDLETAPRPVAHWTVELKDDAAGWPAGLRAAITMAYARAGKSAALTPAMNCVARETARHFLTEKRLPAGRLNNFIISACESVAVQAGYESLRYENVDAAIADESLFQQYQAAQLEPLIARLPTGMREVGFGFRREKNELLLVMTYAKPVVLVPSFTAIPDVNGDVVIEGTADGAVETVSAYVNRGRFGVASCFLAADVQRPRFRFTCNVMPEDDTAWIELLSSEPRRVLAVPFAEVLARRANRASLEYTEELVQEPHESANAEEFVSAVVKELNAIRTNAGLHPVRVNYAQSGTATGMADHYFDRETRPNAGQALRVGVTHYKAPGAAWAQLVVLIVYADYGDGSAR